jgi:hypothetical protein
MDLFLALGLSISARRGSSGYLSPKMYKYCIWFLPPCFSKVTPVQPKQ